MKLTKNYMVVKYLIAFSIVLALCWLVYHQFIVPMLISGDLLGDFIVRLGYVAIPLVLAWTTIDIYERRYE